jgi:hypothetical protein
MTEDVWLASRAPKEMFAFLVPNVWHISLHGRVTRRTLRLFACACCRAVWDRMTDERARRAVEVGERLADGLATEA